MDANSLGHGARFDCIPHFSCWYVSGNISGDDMSDDETELCKYRVSTVLDLVSFHGLYGSSDPKEEDEE